MDINILHDILIFSFLLLAHFLYALELRQYKDKGWWLPVLIAATTIILGVFIINNPFKTMDVVMRIIGACLVYDGLTNTMLVGRFVKSIRDFQKLEAAAEAEAEALEREAEAIDAEYKEL